MKKNDVISISKGNMKLGSIPNISLAPGKTCSAKACETCLVDGCYACKSYRAYPSVKKAWDKNTDAAINNLEAFESALNEYFDSMSAPRFFRVHVGGDFVSKEYAEMWARVASAHSGTKFLAFTKQFDIIRGVDFSDNFAVILSHWPGVMPPADLQEKYTTAYVDDGWNSEEIPADVIECPGDCEHCGMCWSASKHKIDTVFHKH